MAIQSKTLVEKQFGSLNLMDAVISMPPGDMFSCINMMPVNGNKLVSLYGSLVYSTAPGTIAQIWPHILNGNEIIIVQLTTGAVYQFNVLARNFVNTGFTSTQNGLSVAKWGGTDAGGNPEAILLCDTTHGYASWTGSVLTVIDATLTGQAMTVYSGRVWIAKNYVVSFSAPGSYTDFTLASAGGSFAITEESMSTPPVVLIGSQNWMYIIGASMMALNNVTVNNSITTFFVTLVSTTIAIRQPKAALVVDNILFVCTDHGMYAYYGLNGQKISQKVDVAMSADLELSLAIVNSQVILLTNSQICYVVEQQAWISYTLVANQHLGYVVKDGISSWSASGNTINTLFDTGSNQVGYMGMVFDMDNPYSNKQLTRFGMVWENVQGLKSVVTYEIDTLNLSGPSMKCTMDSLFEYFLYSTVVNMTGRFFEVNVNCSNSGQVLMEMQLEFMDGAAWP